MFVLALPVVLGVATVAQILYGLSFTGGLLSSAAGVLIFIGKQAAIQARLWFSADVAWGEAENSGYGGFKCHAAWWLLVN